jgi:polyisoprenoid-binding protein YceI
MSRFRVIPDRSKLWAEARSSIHPVKVETSGLSGDLEAEITDGMVELKAPFKVEIDAERLRSGTGLIDGELQRRLETRKFPRVIGHVKEVSGAGPGRARLAGELSLHGATRKADVEVSVRALVERTLEIEGEKVIDMRDYDLTPPKFLMFKVHPDVKVRARIVAERVDG